MNPRVHKRISAETVLALALYIRGFKVLRDADVAALFRLTVQELYQRIGGLLWSFTPNSFFTLPPSKRNGGRTDARPVLAFTQAGVQFIAGILNDQAAIEIGTDIADALAIQRRSSAYRKRPARRAEDSTKASRYQQSVGRLFKARANAVRGNRESNAYILANADAKQRAKFKKALRQSKANVDVELKKYLKD